MIRIANHNARSASAKTEPEHTVLGRAFLEALERQKAKRDREPQETES